MAAPESGFGVLDWVLAGGMVTLKILLVRKVWWSPWFGLCLQPIWVIYAFLSQQYGFLIVPMVESVIYASNVKKWSRERYEHEFVTNHQDEYEHEEHRAHPEWVCHKKEH